jgi:hypothetical protein
VKVERDEGGRMKGRDGREGTGGGGVDVSGKELHTVNVRLRFGLRLCEYPNRGRECPHPHLRMKRSRCSGVVYSMKDADSSSRLSGLGRARSCPSLANNMRCVVLGFWNSKSSSHFSEYQLERRNTCCCCGMCIGCDHE